MWNPLTLPVAVLGTAAELLRILRSLPAALADLEQRLDRLTEENEAIRQLLEETKASADRIAQFAEPILEASLAGRDEVSRLQDEVAALGRRLERVLAEPQKAAEPVEPAPEPTSGRRGRFGALRRSSPASG